MRARPQRLSTPEMLFFHGANPGGGNRNEAPAATVVAAEVASDQRLG